MSYILEALRRAEADRERERGQVPGLHTPPPPAGVTPAAAARRRWLPWAGGGLLLLAGIGTGAWWVGRPPVPALPGLPAAASSPPATTVTAPPAPPPLASSAAPPLAPASSPYLPALPPPAKAGPAPALPAGPATGPTAAPQPAAQPPLPRLADLPDGLRRELPRLAISGSVYSDDPASRFVIVNGEVVREGARLGPELVLEQIRPRELVLRFRDQRYRQPV